MQIDLSDKKIIVTGASSGIGKAIAQSLMDSGATVALQYHSNASGAESIANSQSRIYQADLSNAEEILDFFKAVGKELLKRDIAVHNAGIFEPHPTDIAWEKWKRVWDESLNINLNAVGQLTYLGINHFKINNGGRMVYIASRAAYKGETEEYLAYAASKGGMVSLARTVARSFGKDNIKSFIIAPGFTKTPMSIDFINRVGEEEILKDFSLKELTKPEDISPIISLIAAGLMDHATGSTIDFNAGSYIH